VSLKSILKRDVKIGYNLYSFVIYSFSI